MAKLYNYSCLLKSVNIFLLTSFLDFFISQLFYITVTLNHKNRNVVLLLVRKLKSWLKLGICLCEGPAWFSQTFIPCLQVFQHLWAFHESHQLLLFLFNSHCYIRREQMGCYRLFLYTKAPQNHYPALLYPSFKSWSARSFPVQLGILFPSVFGEIEMSFVWSNSLTQIHPCCAVKR